MDDDGKIQDRGPADMSTQEEREPIAQIEERLRRLKVPETVIAKHVEQLERLRQPGNKPVRFATGWGPVMHCDERH